MKRFCVNLLFFVFLFAAVIEIRAESGIVWKKPDNPEVKLTVTASETLPQMLGALIREFARYPEKIQIDPAVTGVPEIREIRGQNPETVLNLLLSRHDLSLVVLRGQHRIVPRTKVWRHRPFRKTLNAPVSLENLLRELAQSGQISLRSGTEKLKGKQVFRSLNYASIEEAVFDLARRQNALVVYYPELHVLEWTQDPPLTTRSLTLRSATPKQAQTFLTQVRKELEEIRLVYDVYPAPNTLVLRGSEASVDLAAQLIEQWQKGLPEKSGNEKKITPEESFPDLIAFEPEPPGLEEIPATLLVRLPLHYLSVGPQTVQSNGRSLTIPGVEERLRKALQKRLEDETEIPPVRPQIIPNLLGNTLILEGIESHVEWMKKLVRLWDRPLPLIRIEAHLFETSEVHSRQLGLEFRGQSVSADGTTVTKNPGPYALSQSLGPGAVSQVLRVDAVLRLLQSRGKGRMLSRPVVITLNNVEAEMNSGTIFRIKVKNEKTSDLHELKTGVTLRVTPRLIEDSENHDNDRIWLNVYAEISNPTGDDNVDGIPPINTQSAKTQVFVKNGQPFLLGGLIKNRTGETQSGVPFFKDLPLLGTLFRTSGADERFDHVLVFVTPTRVFADETQTLPHFSEMERAKKIQIKP